MCTVMLAARSRAPLVREGERGGEEDGKLRAYGEGGEYGWLAEPTSASVASPWPLLRLPLRLGPSSDFREGVVELASASLEAGGDEERLWVVGVALWRRRGALRGRPGGCME